MGKNTSYKTLSLFEDESGNPIQGFETPAKIFKTKEKAKRGTYNKKAVPWETLTILLYSDIPIFINIVEQLVYNKMYFLYMTIANNIKNRPLLWVNEYVINFSGLTLWLERFDFENYACAELKGTENMSIANRFKLHDELYELLAAGVELNKAVSMMQPKIKALQPAKKELDRRMIL